MSDLQRDKFEVWFYKELSVAGGAYHLAWQAWQAAIESVVIELPPEHEVAHGYDAREILHAIKNAGVKYE